MVKKTPYFPNKNYSMQATPLKLATCQLETQKLNSQ